MTGGAGYSNIACNRGGRLMTFPWASTVTRVADPSTIRRWLVASRIVWEKVTAVFRDAEGHGFDVEGLAVMCRGAVGDFRMGDQKVDALLLELRDRDSV